MNNNQYYKKTTSLEEIRKILTKEWAFFNSKIEQLTIELEEAHNNVEKFGYLIQEIQRKIDEENSKKDGFAEKLAQYK